MTIILALALTAIATPKEVVDISISPDRLEFIAKETMKACAIDVDRSFSNGREYEPQTQEAIGKSWPIGDQLIGAHLCRAYIEGGRDEHNRNGR